MKVLHTSDIHLKEYGDGRWQSLSNIIDICKDEEVDVLAISGDLFDKDPRMKELRSDLQELFSGNEFDILIIPGNHDREICSDLYFGEDSKLLDDPKQPFEKNGVRFIGLPCEELSKDKVAEKISSLKDVATEDKENIILYHGELLDSFYSEESYGEEEEKRYMPAKICYFDAIPVDYVLAGHFHNNSEIFQLNNGGFFVYSGSPYPITKRETGKRKVNLFETDEDPGFAEVENKFYKQVEISISPFDEVDPLEKIEKKCSQIENRAVPLIKISGYINSEKIDLTESEFVEKVKGLLKENIDAENISELLNLHVRDISNILEDNLFKEFVEKLEAKELSDERKKEIRKVVIQSLMNTGQL